MTSKLYLAHPLDSREEMRKWELEFEEKSGITIINPFYDSPREDIKLIDSGRHERYEKLNSAEIVARDLSYIDSADGVIAVVNGMKSYGTIQEMFYAGMIKQKPVHSLITCGDEDHPWLKECSITISTDIMELENILLRNYGK